MRGFLTCWDGRRFELPDLLSWHMEYTSGVPCDSFTLSCLWDGDKTALAAAVRFSAEEDGETVFTGVVDEIECGWDGDGGRLSLSGRGMAALLLDNEALGADYQMATLDDILRDHVTPYGIQVGERVKLPAVNGFSVASGSSEWQALYDFARYHGGVAPRFDRQGRLILAPWKDGVPRVVDEKAPITRIAHREIRYGVLSEILVRDRTTKNTQKVLNETFCTQGGRCRRVLTMPGKSSYQAMRYSGEYQIKRSAAQRLRLELRIAASFFARPGDLLELRLEKPGIMGLWRVFECATGVDERGVYTELMLGEPGAAVS